MRMIKGVAIVTWATMLFLSSCAGSSSDPSRGCAGESSYVCAAFCGSDLVAMTECVHGAWKCPAGYVNGLDECPVGTCFGPAANCCNSQGFVAQGVCSAIVDSLPSGGGTCPAGTFDCNFGDPDAGAAGHTGPG